MSSMCFIGKLTLVSLSHSLQLRADNDSLKEQMGQLMAEVP